MTSEIFTEISFIIAIGASVAFIMHLLRQPLMISHILTGVIVGPTMLDLVHSDEIVEVFSKIGIALLLFIIGLGLNLKVIKELGKVSFVVGFSQVGLTTVMGTIVASALGYGLLTSFAIGVGLAFSSTIIVLKLLSDKKEVNRLHGKISIGVLIVQDLLATVALFIATAWTGDGGQNALEIVGKGAVLAGSVGILSLNIIPMLSKVIADSQEFLFLFAIGWGLGIASIFEISGFSIEIGALIAGMSLAHMPYAQEIGSRLRPLRDFFIVIFFISLGLLLDISSFSDVWIPVVLLSLGVLIINPISILLTMGIMGYAKKTSFSTALLMSQISEFSLVFIILLVNGGKIDTEVLTVMTLVAMVTIAVSTYLIIYDNKIYKILEDKLALFERRKVKFNQKESANYDIVLFGFNKGGSQFVKTFKDLNKSFVVIDYDPEVIDVLERKQIHHLYGDVTDPELFEEINVQKVKLAVSVIDDKEVNKQLAIQLQALNPRAVFIGNADNPETATELYERGASYVMMPHYIGSEKIGSFISKNGFKKSAFKDWRDRHILALQEHARHIQALKSKEKKTQIE